MQGMAKDTCLPKLLRAELVHEFNNKSDRPTYYPARLASGKVTLPPWQGSADLRALSATNGFAVVPAGEMRYAAGSPMDVLMPELD
jgi:molybdopterin biosynthesis enzyme